MNGARLDYIDAIVDYDRAQFELYVALGQPPANALAHPVPTQGVAPSGVTPAAPARDPAGGGTRPGPAAAASEPTRPALPAARRANPSSPRASCRRHPVPPCGQLPGMRSLAEPMSHSTGGKDAFMAGSLYRSRMGPDGQGGRPGSP